MVCVFCACLTNLNSRLPLCSLIAYLCSNPCVQTVLGPLIEHVRDVDKSSSELSSVARTLQNAFNLYIRTRPAASSESMKVCVCVRCANTLTSLAFLSACVLRRCSHAAHLCFYKHLLAHTRNITHTHTHTQPTVACTPATARRSASNNAGCSASLSAWRCGQ